MNRPFFLALLRDLRAKLVNIDERILFLEETLSDAMDEEEFHHYFQEMKRLYEEQDRIPTEIKKV